MWFSGAKGMMSYVSIFDIIERYWFVKLIWVNELYKNEI